MTSSTGCSGLTLFGIAAEPHDAVAHRREIDDAGTPVKSCSSTRAGANEISFCAALLTSQRASASMSAAFTNRPSSWRSRFSSRIFSEYGRRATSGNPAACERGQAVDLDRCGRPTGSAVRVPKLFTVGIESVLENIHRTTRDSRRSRREPRADASRKCSAAAIKKTLPFTLMSSILHFPDIHSRRDSNVRRSDISQDGPQETTA